MADLQMVLSEAVKLNQRIAQFLKFSTYPDYDDLSGLDIDFADGEQLLLLEELRRITDRLADVQEYISVFLIVFLYDTFMPQRAGKALPAVSTIAGIR